MNLTARITAMAQVGLSALFMIGYFLMLGLFLTGYVKTPPEWKDTLGALLSVLTAGALLILQFWFSRERSKEPTSGNNST